MPGKDIYLNCLSAARNRREKKHYKRAASNIPTDFTKRK